MTTILYESLNNKHENHLHYIIYMKIQRKPTQSHHAFILFRLLQIFKQINLP